MVLSNVYLAAQLVVLPGSLIWLFRRDKGVYRRLRDTILATWLLAGRSTRPSPSRPRGSPGSGWRTPSPSRPRSGSPGTRRCSTTRTPPSRAALRVRLRVGIALAAAARRPLVKALWLSWGPLVSLAVVATANHYVFDIAAGLLVAGAGYLVGRLPRRVPTFLPAPRLALSGENDMTVYDAVLFDLDGVLTDTAALHAACWKQTFDEVLQEPFDVDRDYLAHVDGKSRHDGARDMLRARGVEPDEADWCLRSPTASRRSSSARWPTAASRRSPARSPGCASCGAPACGPPSCPRARTATRSCAPPGSPSCSS